MVEEQLRQYKTMESSLLALAKEDSRYLSSWLQNGLARPNSAFRNEKIYSVKSESIKKELMDLPAVIGERQLLPKEKWLQEFCLSERNLGRKVLVYLRQTGTRDIQDHIKAILESGGLRVTVLAGSIDPRKREDWIAKKTPYTDVLVCNPKLVETGLDLIDYNTVVFAETEFSLYTMWQAIRRVWRLGQTKPVKAVFSIYNGSLEEKALTLMGRKIKAAQLLYGDEVGGALVPAEDGDFLTQLARDVLSGKKLADLTALFAEDVRVQHNPVDLVIQSDTPNNPIAVITLPSPNSVKSKTWDEWLKERGETTPSRKKPQPQKMVCQESLF
jgi:SNF2 family DNA or RNA helicase